MQELFEKHGRVEALTIDEEFTAHMADESRQYASHIVSADEVNQVHSGSPKYITNAGSARRAPVIMVGPTNNGRILVVPIEPTHTYGVWHPVTAFEATSGDSRRYEEQA